MKYRLGNICKIGDGLHGTPNYCKNNEFYFINGNNLKGELIDLSNARSVSKAEYLKYNPNLIPQKTVLLSINGTLGNTAIYNGESIILSKSVAFFECSTDIITPEYLKLYFESCNFQNILNNMATGTTIKNVGLKSLRSLMIDLPSINIQREIVNIIKPFENKLYLNNQINDNLTQISLLNLANMIKNKSYEIHKISDLDIIISDHVANGSFKALKENVTYYDENNYALFLRNIDFKNRLDGANRYIDKESYNYLKKSHLFGGEVVISNVADVGTIHRVPFINRPMVIGNNQIFIKSVHSFLTEYLYVYFKSYWGQNSIFSITSGSAQQKFNKTDFRALEIPIPSPNWILTNIRPFILAKDKIFNETKSLEQLKKNLLNNYF